MIMMDNLMKMEMKYQVIINKINMMIIKTHPEEEKRNLKINFSYNGICSIELVKLYIKII
jgi:hypothetical protein